MDTHKHADDSSFEVKRAELERLERMIREFLAEVERQLEAIRSRGR